MAYRYDNEAFELQENYDSKQNIGSEQSEDDPVLGRFQKYTGPAIADPRRDSRFEVEQRWTEHKEEPRNSEEYAGPPPQDLNTRRDTMVEVAQRWTESKGKIGFEGVQDEEHPPAQDLSLRRDTRAEVASRWTEHKAPIGLEELERENYDQQPVDYDHGDDQPPVRRNVAGHSRWNNLKNALPSQADNPMGTLRFRRRTQRQSHLPRDSVQDGTDHDIAEPTEEELIEDLNNLREQPWSLPYRKQRRTELRTALARKGATANWYFSSTADVSSAVKKGRSKVSDFLKSIDPWQRMLKRIEGHYGASVAAVFNFMKDLIQLNLFLSVLVVSAVVVPNILLILNKDYEEATEAVWISSSESWCGFQIINNGTDETLACHDNYTQKVYNNTNTVEDLPGLVGDFLQGTGMLELTVLFGGWYPVNIKNEDYQSSLAYILTMLMAYLASFIYVAYYMAKFLRTSSLSSQDYGLTFSNIVFTGWDFSISNNQAAATERTMTVCEVRTAFDDLDFKQQRNKLTRGGLIRLYLLRMAINLFIMALIGAGWAGIYFLVDAKNNNNGKNDFEKFLWEYAPTVTVSAFAFVYPIVFDVLVKFEKYTGRTTLFITLARCVLVRLTSLGILIITTLGIIYDGGKKTIYCETDNEFICWETAMGQQIYSQVVLDFLVALAITFGLNVVRRVLRGFDGKFCQMVGTMEFYVPGHVLDVVYLQTLCWIGLFYSPLMPTLVLVNLCCMFFFKLFTIAWTCVPATRVFRASRSSAMFMTILTVAIALAIVSTGFAVMLIKPSISCGPFKGLDYAWQALTNYICQIQGAAVAWIRVLLFALDDPIVTLVMFVLVVFLATYYTSLVSARGALIQRLEKKLKVVAKEKNYLMELANRSPQG